jgi:hypothetical protein
MSEQFPTPQPEERFTEIEQSRFLQFGNDVHLPGDPATVEDFARAEAYLETITNHCIEFGPWWEKKPQDVVYELDYHNAWHRQEVEQERKAGEKQAEYREINVHQLRALSKRRVLAFEDSGWEVTQAYRVVRFFDKLIEDAVLEQEQLEQLITRPYQESETPFGPSSDHTEEIPF